MENVATMNVDVKKIAKLTQLHARRRGAIILVLTCLGAPLGLLALVIWGTFTGLCVFGAVMALVAILWVISVVRSSLDDSGSETE